MKFQLLLATANPSKARELSAALEDLDLEILTLADFPELKLPPEDGATFEENSRIKAEFCCQKTGLPALADDSGILVEALPGELGVQTVRFGAGANASDEEWLEYFLKKMESKQNRRAKFVCVLALANCCSRTNPSALRASPLNRGEVEVPPAKGEFRGVSYSPAGEKGPIQTKFFRGEIEGEILQELGAPILPRIPLSSVFLADGATKVFAAMSEAEKAKFSHRGRALELAKKFLENELK